MELGACGRFLDGERLIDASTLSGSNQVVRFPGRERELGGFGASGLHGPMA